MKLPHRIASAVAAAALATSALAAGPKAYVGNFKDNTVSVVDTVAAQVVATVPVAAGPDGIVITPDGSRVFVSGAGASSVSEIDSASDTVAHTIEVGSVPHGLAITPDGRRLLVAVNGADRVAVVDIASHAVTATVAVAKPHTIAVRPGGGQIYVASQEPGRFALVRIDLATTAVAGRIALEKPPRDIEFSHDGKALYVTLAGVNAVQVVDPESDKIVASIPTGVSPHLAKFPAGSPAGLVVVQGPGELMLFDPATHAPLRSISVGKQPHWVDVAADGKTAFVTNEGSNDLSLVDLTSAQVRTIAVGNAPRKVAVQRPVASAGARVSINNFAFSPADSTIDVGQELVWANDDGAPHGVAFGDGGAGKDLMLPGERFGRSFDRPGVYAYVCSVHAYMTGMVTVHQN